MLLSLEKVRKYQCFFLILKDSAKDNEVYLGLDPPFDLNFHTVHTHDVFSEGPHAAVAIARICMGVYSATIHN